MNNCINNTNCTNIISFYRKKIDLFHNCQKKQSVQTHKSVPLTMAVMFAIISVGFTCVLGTLTSIFQAYMNTSEIGGSLLSQVSTTGRVGCVSECSRMVAYGCNVARYNSGTNECELMRGFCEIPNTTWSALTAGWGIFVQVHVL